LSQLRKVLNSNRGGNTYFYYIDNQMFPFRVRVKNV